MSVVGGCPACADNELSARGEDVHAVAELTTGYVRLNPTQYYRGATFLRKLNYEALDNSVPHLH